MLEGSMGQKPLILIIDDEPSMRELFTTRLMQDFLVITAANGRDGLMQAYEKKPDLILLDVKMPEMDGFQVLQALRAKDDWGKHLPVIFLTNVALTTDEAYAEVMKNEPAYYLMKSEVSSEELIQKIRDRLSAP